MIEVILYNNKSDPIVANKSLSVIKKTLCEFYTGEGNISITKPSIVMDQIIDVNYIYIDKFKRYYYVNNVNILEGGRCVLSCNVDPLMSFYYEIISTEQNIIRQENEYNMYIDDPYLKTSHEVQRHVINFDPPQGGWLLTHKFGPTDSNFVLNTI